MRTITKEFEIYKFNELDEQVQNKVISDYIQDLLYSVDYEKLHKNSNLYKAINECEKMKTPWFIGEYVFEYCKKDILKELKKYEYYKNGGLYYENK